MWRIRLDLQTSGITKGYRKKDSFLIAASVGAETCQLFVAAMRLCVLESVCSTHALARRGNLERPNTLESPVNRAANSSLRSGETPPNHEPEGEHKVCRVLKLARVRIKKDSMNVLILHLSDIHIRDASDPILKRATQITECLYSRLPDASAVLVLVTGDVAFSGTEAQYELAGQFFQEIESDIRAERDVPVHFVICPGNHDCDFTSDTGTRALVLEALGSHGGKAVDESIVSTLTSVQHAYFGLEERMREPGRDVAGDALWRVHRFSFGGRSVVVDAVNVAWCSRKHEQIGSLIFPFERYANLVKEDVSIRLTTLHHPPHWFSQAMYKPFRQFLRSTANIVLSGHEHVGTVSENIDAETGQSAYIEGCVLQGESDLGDSSFYIIELNLDEGLYLATHFKWDGKEAYAAGDASSWDDYRALPKKQRSPFPVEPAFAQQLTDPGASFGTLRGDNLKLADVFVYPDLEEPQERSAVKKNYSSTILLDAARLQRGVLLRAEEKVGATSLLYHLFEHHHDHGLVPLYLRGPDLRGTTPRDIERALVRCVSSQYGPNAFTTVERTSTSQKVLLLDDFDSGPLRSMAARMQALSFLRKRFKHLVVVVSELFSIHEHAEADKDGLLRELHSLTILPFGYARRTELVRKWFHLTNADGSVEEAAVTAKCQHAERLLDTVMQKTIVPSLPLYLLTVLQSIEAGQSSNLQDSALGQYYSFLLVEGLKSAGVQKSRWEPVLEYCAHLAWEFHNRAAQELSLSDLEAFTRRYSDQQVKVNLEPMLEDLVNARILSRYGDFYRIRYHYIYYYLKGRYIADRLDSGEMQTYVRHACAHLYVRRNANTILFLAHHAHKSQFFTDCIVDAMKRPFSTEKEVRFDGEDTADLAEFARDVPKLVYNGDSPEVHRDKTNELRDQLSEEDALVEEEETDGTLSLVAQFMAMLKTVEILGQLLKNQFAGYPRAKRIELLATLFRGPLRGLAAFLKNFLDDKDTFVSALEEALIAKGKIKDAAECRRLAQQFLAQIVHGLCFATLAKVSISVSSEDLAEDIASAIGIVDSPAARLIRLGVLLDSPKNLPKSEIQWVLDEVKSDVVGARIIAMLTLRRLYMFKTTEQDRQWLASTLQFEMKNQQAIAFNNRGVRRTR